MRIDARDQKIEDLLRRLKELFAADPKRELEIEVVLRSREDLNRAIAFVRMCGYETGPEESEGIYRVMIRGTSCGCV